jgi:hypothetical protein
MYWRQPCERHGQNSNTSVNWFSKPTHWDSLSTAGSLRLVQSHHDASPWCRSMVPLHGLHLTMVAIDFVEEFKVLVQSFRCFKAIKLIL